MFEFALSSWRAGLRGRSIQSILVLGVLLMCVAYLSSSFSPRQPQTVALDVGFSGLRIALVLLGLFWIQELVTKEIDRRTVIFALSYPVPRWAYLIGRFAGILALLALATLALALLLWLLVLLAGLSFDQQYPPHLGAPFWLAVVAVWLDVVVVSAFGLFVAALSTAPILPLALGAAFAVGAKSLGVARDYILTGADGQTDLVLRMSPALDFLHWVLPDLSRLDWRTWPMYGVIPSTSEAGWAIVMSIAYSGFLLALSVRVFSRREFL